MLPVRFMRFFGSHLFRESASPRKRRNLQLCPPEVLEDRLVPTGSTYYWIGASTASTTIYAWNDPANWAANPNGTGTVAGSILGYPSASDNAVFNGNPNFKNQITTLGTAITAQQRFDFGLADAPDRHRRQRFVDGDRRYDARSDLRRRHHHQRPGSRQRLQHRRDRCESQTWGNPAAGLAETWVEPHPRIRSRPRGHRLQQRLDARGSTTPTLRRSRPQRNIPGAPASTLCTIPGAGCAGSGHYLRPSELPRSVSPPPAATQRLRRQLDLRRDDHQTRGPRRQRSIPRRSDRQRGPRFLFHDAIVRRRNPHSRGRQRHVQQRAAVDDVGVDDDLRERRPNPVAARRLHHQRRRRYPRLQYRHSWPSACPAFAL